MRGGRRLGLEDEREIDGAEFEAKPEGRRGRWKAEGIAIEYAYLAYTDQNVVKAEWRLTFSKLAIVS